MNYGTRAAEVLKETATTGKELLDSNQLTKMDKLLVLLVAQQASLAAQTSLLSSVVEELGRLRLVAEQAYAPRSDRGSFGGSTPSGATK